MRNIEVNKEYLAKGTSLLESDKNRYVFQFAKERAIFHGARRTGDGG